jgi:hypothetical protein
LQERKFLFCSAMMLLFLIARAHRLFCFLFPAFLWQMAWSAPPILPRLPRLPDVRRSVRLPALYVTAPAQSFPVLKVSLRLLHIHAVNSLSSREL